MGFTTGFTGGVTLTLSLAYLAVLTHQRNRQAQSDILRAQHSVLHSLAAHDPALATPAPSSPTTPSTATTAPARPPLLETAKSRWNAEIAAAVRWAQTKDWDEVREDAELALARLWGSVSGSPVGEEARRDVDAARSRAAEGVGLAKAETTHTARGVLQEARDRSQAVAASAVAQARETSRSVADAVHVRAEQGKAAVARGVEKSKEVVDKAKVAVGIAEERLEDAVDAKLLHLSEVDRALAQRYKESGGEVTSKSIEEALAERYKPIEQQDRRKLQAI